MRHQCHASRPQEGRNSLVAAADMILHVRDLESIYAQVDPLFQPPCCTFVPTRHEENVPNINSLPGKDVFYIDCRILPGISHDDVLASAREIMEAVAERHGVTVDITTVTNAPASPATPPDSEVVLRLSAGIREIYGIERRRDRGRGLPRHGHPRCGLGQRRADLSSRQRILPHFPHHRRRAGARPDAV